MGSLKAGVKSGNAEYKTTGEKEEMVSALVELASFCDEQLRLKEDEGKLANYVGSQYCRNISQLKCVDDERGETLFFSTLVGTYLPTKVEKKRRLPPFMITLFIIRIETYYIAIVKVIVT